MTRRSASPSFAKKSSALDQPLAGIDRNAHPAAGYVHLRINGPATVLFCPLPRRSRQSSGCRAGRDPPDHGRDRRSAEHRPRVEPVLDLAEGLAAADRGDALAGRLPGRPGPARHPGGRVVPDAELSPRYLAAACCGGFGAGFAFGLAASIAFRCAMCSSSQMVIGLAMYQVEYVPEMIPTSIASAKSGMVPTP